MICGCKGPGAEFKVRGCQGNHVNTRASDATISITFDSQAHVIRVHKHCTKFKTLLFALPDLESIYPG